MAKGRKSGARHRKSGVSGDGSGVEGGGSSDGGAVEGGEVEVAPIPRGNQEADDRTRQSSAPPGWQFRRYDLPTLREGVEAMEAQLEAEMRAWRRMPKRLVCQNSAMENYYYNFEPVPHVRQQAEALCREDEGEEGAEEGGGDGKGGEGGKSGARKGLGGLGGDEVSTPKGEQMVSVRPSAPRIENVWFFHGIVWGGAAMLIMLAFSLWAMYTGAQATFRLPNLPILIPEAIYPADLATLATLSSFTSLLLIPFLQLSFSLLALLLGDNPLMVEFGLSMADKMHSVLCILLSTASVALRAFSPPVLTTGGKTLTLLAALLLLLAQAVGLHFRLLESMAHVLDSQIPEPAPADKGKALLIRRKMGCLGRSCAPRIAFAALQTALCATTLLLLLNSQSDSPLLFSVANALATAAKQANIDVPIQNTVNAILQNVQVLQG